MNCGEGRGPGSFMIYHVQQWTHHFPSTAHLGVCVGTWSLGNSRWQPRDSVPGTHRPSCRRWPVGHLWGGITVARAGSTQREGINVGTSGHGQWGAVPLSPTIQSTPCCALDLRITSSQHQYGIPQAEDPHGMGSTFMERCTYVSGSFQNVWSGPAFCPPKGPC